MKIFFFFSLMVFIQQSVAEIPFAPKHSSVEAKERCGSVDLREKLPPIRDQGQTGWCYSFVAADLASFHTGKNISAVDMALNYNDSLRAKLRNFLVGLTKYQKIGLKDYEKEGGRVSEALDATPSAGLCLERELSSSPGVYRDLRELLILFNDIKVEFSNDAFYPNTPEQKSWAYQIVCHHRYQFANMFPGINWDDLVDILIKSGEDDFVRKTARYACQNRISFDKKKVMGLSWGNTEIMKPSLDHLLSDLGKQALREKGWDVLFKDFYDDLYKDKIHQLLDAENIAAVTYNSRVLSDRNYDDNIVFSDHVSTIVGRRWNESAKKCELLLRNSYGTKCFHQYDKTYDCEEGNIWIDEDALMRATTGIDYIEKN